LAVTVMVRMGMSMMIVGVAVLVCMPMSMGVPVAVPMIVGMFVTLFLIMGESLAAAWRLRRFLFSGGCAGSLRIVVHCPRPFAVYSLRASMGFYG
jgi:hypothetical protein